jgi:hypothetical protein
LERQAAYENLYHLLSIGCRSADVVNRTGSATSQAPGVRREIVGQALAVQCILGFVGADRSRRHSAKSYTRLTTLTLRVAGDAERNA